MEGVTRRGMQRWTDPAAPSTADRVVRAWLSGRLGSEGLSLLPFGGDPEDRHLGLPANAGQPTGARSAQVQRRATPKWWCVCGPVPNCGPEATSGPGRGTLGLAPEPPILPPLVAVDRRRERELGVM